ncbi:UvrD-helicase domain-containing protein [Acidithiobacillus thiooxidans]|uniref:UvrD-helicase domain-containing protein n=1 Tax=Acidithiobacillus thiooxidans TaxID=930 RepID=UPI00285E4AB0|nr:UvrD-helicase domain-containing protein [Acidithiobacillus thiooxidans]MDR7927121.1 UvrD-helicase domain-containing protein [Acidithiobacillus thiooxidans]
MPLTQEQSEILNFVQPQNCNGLSHVLLHAYAGSGKSFILREIAKKLPGPGIYLAFNRAIVADIQKTLPAHFTAMTTHQLALQSIQKTDPIIYKQIASSLREDGGRVPLPLLVQKVSGFPARNGLVMAGYVMQGIRNFCNAPDRLMDARHLPDLPARIKKADVLDLSHKTWEAMLRFQIPVTHDFYFKAWTLMDAAAQLPYAHRLVDEAQDTNPSLLGLMFRQRQGITWWAGDPYQSIYSWRGAVDALNAIAQESGIHEGHLTQSFRFGDAPADMATQLLSTLGEKRPVRGTGTTDIQFAPLKSRDAAPFLRKYPKVAWVAFNNVSLLDVAMHCIERGITFHIVGQGREEKSLIYAAMKLKSGKPDAKGPLSMYAQWSELENEAHSVPDGEAAKLIKLYRHPGFGALLDGLQRGTRSESEAQVILTTAHRSKGREWDCVIIDPDMDARDQPTLAQCRKKRRFFVDSEGLHFDNREDIHLRYVAFTRARKLLLMGTPNLFQWWSASA